MLKLRTKTEKSRQNSEDQYEQKQYFFYQFIGKKNNAKGHTMWRSFLFFFQKLLAESHTHFVHKLVMPTVSVVLSSVGDPICTVC